MPEASSLQILLIEDNDGDARLLRERVRDLGIRATVEHAASLEALNGGWPVSPADIVLLDLGLPGSRGAETVRRYRELDEETPVVVLTGLADPDEATRAIRAGADEYLVKGEITDRALERTLRFVHERHEARRELERARQQLESIFDLAPVGIGLTDAATGEIVDVNQAFVDLVGYSREEVLGRSTMDLGLWQDAELREQVIRELSEPGDVIRDRQVQYRSRGGATRHVLLSARRLEQDGNEFFLWTTHNITSLVEAKLESLGAHDRLERIVETMAEPLTIVDPDGRIVFANEAAEELFQLSRSEVESRTYEASEWRITDEEGRPFPVEDLPFSRVMKSGRPVRNVTHAIERGDGERRILSVNAAPLQEEAGEPRAVVATMRDVTEQRRLEEALRHEALHDPLTELPNRELFTSRISQAAARSRRSGDGFGVAVLDLDRFKVVNDSLGHTAGDRVLMEVADRLRTVTREQDTVARIGGDEFGLLLPGAQDRAGVRRVLGRVRSELEEPFTVGDEEFRLGTSTGAHLHRPEDASGDGESTVEAGELIRYADIAMFRAKDTGAEEAVFFTPEDGETRMRLLQREQELRRAIDDGEIVPFYQPLLDLRDGSVVGVEAVARWHHPERGLVSPADFIPLAEESGLIVPLGESVFEQACRDLREIDEAEPDRRLRLFVNFSARELSSSDRVDHARETLEATGLDPSRLTVEVTETALLRGSEQAAELIELGARLAVDDFGTGYASLRYLKQFEVSTLKIDRSFVAGAPQDPEDRAIVDAIVSLAESLGVETIAEGIETEPQEETARELGIQLVQGYRYAKPRPVDELGDALRSAAEAVRSTAGG